jgi:hypothetical protein
MSGFYEENDNWKFKSEIQNSDVLFFVNRMIIEIEI